MFPRFPISLYHFVYTEFPPHPQHGDVISSLLLWNYFTPCIYTVLCKQPWLWWMKCQWPMGCFRQSSQLLLTGLTLTLATIYPRDVFRKSHLVSLSAECGSCFLLNFHLITWASDASGGIIYSTSGLPLRVYNVNFWNSEKRIYHCRHEYIYETRRKRWKM